jgi:membrane-bound lytic murein transglycosylase D
MKFFALFFWWLIPLAAIAQHSAADVSERWEPELNSWFHQRFSQRLSKNPVCPPPFKENIEGKSDFESALEALPVHPEKENEYIELLLNQNCSRFLEMQSLADVYFPLLHKHLVRVGMDRDYAFLTMVLSGLNPSFRSNKDEAGLWALDFVRAKRQGLRVDQNIDERRAPSIATEAATELLRAYFEVFEKNHLKTVAAFVKGAKWTNARKESEILLDPEMIGVLRALKICIRLRKNFERENQLVFWLNEFNAFDAIPITDTIHKEALISILQLEKSTFNNMNPAYIGQFIPAPYRAVPVIVPVEKIDLFKQRADSLYAWKPTVKKPSPPPPPKGEENEYIVQSGDVLGKIAGKFGVRVSQIMDWNQLRSDRIDVGQRLLIYAITKPSNKPASSKEESRKSTTSSPAVSPGTNESIYTVKSGDSLWLIAQKFPGVSAENIMEWNKISTDIRPGQKLIIRQNP